MNAEREQVLVQGLVAGLIGYATVVVFFALVNILSGRSPFYTAAALGAVLFYGAQDGARVAVDVGPVLAYNGLHLFASLVIGQAASWLFFGTERQHALWYLAFFLFLAGFLASVVIMGIIGAEIAHAVQWWSIAVANLTWVLGMGGYLWLMHRDLFHEIETEEM